MAEAPVPAPEGIPGSELRGPFPVGRYAAFLRDELRKRARVQLFGEVWNLGSSRTRVYFELRDATGAVPCAMWRDEFEALGLDAGLLADGARIVVAGGPDYYPGSRTSSPSFSFAVSELRVAGEGDLLAQLARLRRQLHGEGLFEPQKRLPRRTLPRSVGVVTGERGKAGDDVLAGLRRRGWAGRLVWAFAPVQDRHAAPAITRALQDLAACGGVEVIVVARGGGSMADLFAFCDETLCRTVALLAIPVVASVGHHTDRTLLDDVAAVSCSTPTHAAEAAVPLDCAEARTGLAAAASSLARAARRAVIERARFLAAAARSPSEHLTRHRARLHQQVRELRASARRGAAERRRLAGTHALVLDRKARATVLATRTSWARTLATSTLALAAHDPERTLERGYALVEDGEGELVTGAGQAREAAVLDVRFHDGRVRAHPQR